MLTDRGGKAPTVQKKNTSKRKLPAMPFLETLGTLLPIVGKAFDSFSQSRTARENTDKTIAANKALAEYQYSKDVEMWNRGNVYNDPMHQMERLRKAGLNPNMVYGSGSAAGMASGPLPKYNAPTLDYNYRPPVEIAPMIESFQDFRMKSAQTRVLDSNANVAEDTEWSRGQLTRDKAILQRISRDNARQHAGPMAAMQRQFLEQRIRTGSLEQDKIIEATNNLALQNEYYAEKAISQLLGSGVGAVKGISSMFKRTGKAAGKLSGGTLKAPQGPRYNSSTFWNNLKR